MNSNTVELTKKVLDRCDELMEVGKKQLIDIIDTDDYDEDAAKSMYLMFGLVRDFKELAMDYAEKMEQISEINEKLDKLLRRKEP